MVRNDSFEVGKVGSVLVTTLAEDDTKALMAIAAVAIRAIFGVWAHILALLRINK